jgi:hypothetical protein
MPTDIFGNTAPEGQLTFGAILAIIQQQYPQMLPFITEPGIFDILKQAIEHPAEWSPERFTAAIQNTPFFKNTPLNQRQWYVLDVTDPATARQRKEDASIGVRQIAQQLGLNVSAYDSAIISLNAAVNGWDASRIKMELVAHSNGASLGPGGIGDTMTQFEGYAASQGVPVNHNDLYWWAANTEGGNVTEAGFRDFITQQAINLYPALRPSLEQGMTVAQYAAPYFQLAANELGINPNQINLLNPKWTGLFLNKGGQGGAQTVVDLNDALAKIRTDPAFGYDHGLPAVTQASRFAAQLQQKFGITG